MVRWRGGVVVVVGWLSGHSREKKEYGRIRKYLLHNREFCCSILIRYSTCRFLSIFVNCIETVVGNFKR